MYEMLDQVAVFSPEFEMNVNGEDNSQVMVFDKVEENDWSWKQHEINVQTDTTCNIFKIVRSSTKMTYEQNIIR